MSEIELRDCLSRRAPCPDGFQFPVAGSIVFVPTSGPSIQADYVAASFSFAGGQLLGALSVTFDASVAPSDFLTAAYTSPGTDYTTVTVRVPVTGGPPGQTVDVLTLGAVEVDSWSLPSTPSDNQGLSLSLTAGTVGYQWNGNALTWNFLTMTGSGCSPPAGQAYVDLAGNASSLLGTGDVEIGPWNSGSVPDIEPSITLLSTGGEVLGPCLFFPSLAETNVDADVHALSPLSDAFGTQLRALTFELDTSAVVSYTVGITAAGLEDAVTLIATDGAIVSREFDAGDGSLVSEVSAPFSF